MRSVKLAIGSIAAIIAMGGAATVVVAQQDDAVEELPIVFSPGGSTQGAEMSIEGTVTAVHLRHIKNADVIKRYEGSYGHRKAIDRDQSLITFHMRVDECLMGSCPEVVNWVVDTFAADGKKLSAEQVDDVRGDKYRLWLMRSNYFAGNAWRAVHGEVISH